MELTLECSLELNLGGRPGEDLRTVFFDVPYLWTTKFDDSKLHLKYVVFDVKVVGLTLLGDFKSCSSSFHLLLTEFLHCLIRILFPTRPRRHCYNL